jgi:splicing factor 3A subunit 2
MISLANSACLFLPDACFAPLARTVWLASVPASPPAEPDAPVPPDETPDEPEIPDLPPDDTPPEIDDPPPDEVPPPVREPPVMPPPTVVTEIRVDPYWRHRPIAERDPYGIARESGSESHMPHVAENHRRRHAGFFLQPIRQCLTASCDR